MDAESHEAGSVLLEKHLQLHLTKELARALTSSAQADAHLATQQTVDLGSRWPNVGPADIGVRLLDTTILVELKWGKSSLHNCAWDFVKLATALATGSATAAFLVAGAPVAAWTGDLGAEFFADGSWSAAALRERYSTWWHFWEKDVPTTRPFQVPSPMSSRAVSAGPFTIAGSAWELRCAEVHLGGRWSWTRWATTLPSGTTRSGR